MKETTRHVIRQCVAMARAQNWRAVELKQKRFERGAQRARMLRDDEMAKARAIKREQM